MPNAAALERREDMHRIVRATLARGWTEQYGVPYRILDQPLPGGQEWRLHAPLSTYSRPTVARPARKFLANRSRYTRSRSLMIKRWIRGTASSSKLVQRYGPCSAAFWVHPGVPHPDQLVILLGNQRLRIFDLRRGTVRVLAKDGFDRSTVRNEIELRTSSIAGPYLPISSSQAQGAWFEEPLIEGFSLEACPPWWSYADLIAGAASRLKSWLDLTMEERDVQQHVARLADEAVRRSQVLDGLYGCQIGPRVEHVFRSLIQAVTGVGEIPFALTHGDFQPANVLVPLDGGAPVFVDWEYASFRFREYDGLVHSLLTRVPRGRTARIARYVEDGAMTEDCGLVATGERDTRRVGATLCVLEDLDRQLQEAVQGRYIQLPSALSRLLSDAEQLTASHLRA